MRPEALFSGAQSGPGPIAGRSRAGACVAVRFPFLSAQVQVPARQRGHPFREMLNGSLCPQGPYVGQSTPACVGTPGPVVSLERRSVGRRVLGPARSPRLSALSPFSPVSASLAPLCGAYPGRLWLSARRLAQSLVGISWCRMSPFPQKCGRPQLPPVGGPVVCGRSRGLWPP